jgi:RNA polymerase sigma factor (sigma-70 family)
MIDDSELRHLLRDSLEKNDDEMRWNDITTHVDRIARLALRGFPLVEGDREDLVQEIILRLITNDSLRRQVGEANSVTLYLARTFRNAGLDLLRRRERHQRLRDERRSTPAVNEVERLHERLALADIISRLSPADRELLRLRFWDGRTLSEIALYLETSISTAASRLLHIVARIREDLSNRSS